MALVAPASPKRVNMTDFNAGHRQLLERHYGRALPFTVVVDRGGVESARLQSMLQGYLPSIIYPTSR